MPSWWQLRSDPPHLILIPEFFPINTGGETHQEKQPWESDGSEG